jgi:hypothetical protein
MVRYYGERIGILDVIRDTFRLLRKNFILLFCIALIGAVISLAGSTYAFLFGEEISGFTIFLLGAADVFITVWINAALIFSSASLHYGNQFSLAEMKKVTRSKYWSAFIATMKLALIILVPILLIYYLAIVIPAVGVLVLLPAFCFLFYLSFRYLFVVHSVILEEHAIGAFKNSSRLVDGRFWKIVGGTLLFSAIFITISLIDTFYIADTLIGQPAWVIYLHDVAISFYDVALLVIETAFTTLLYLRLRELEAGPGRSASNSSTDGSDSGYGGYHEPKI